MTTLGEAKMSSLKDKLEAQETARIEAAKEEVKKEPKKVKNKGRIK